MHVKILTLLVTVAAVSADTVITHGSGIVGASALPNQAGNYKMVFNPQTGRTEFQRIGDVQGSGKGSAQASGSTSSGGSGVGSVVSSSSLNGRVGVGSVVSSSSLDGKPGVATHSSMSSSSSTGNNGQGMIQLSSSTQQFQSPTVTTSVASDGATSELFINGQKVDVPANGTIKYSDPETGITQTITRQHFASAVQAAEASSSSSGGEHIIDIGGGAKIRESNGEAFVTHNGKEERIPKNGTLVIKDPETGETRTIQRTVMSSSAAAGAGGSSSTGSATIVRTQGPELPGQGPKVPLQVGNQTVLAPNGTTFVTDPNTGRTTFNIPLRTNFPECGYSLHTGGADGPVLSSPLTAPTQLTHVWSCEFDSQVATKDQTPSCLFVHSCQATDAQGNSVKLIDENGCSLDTTKVPQLQWLGDNKIVTTTSSDLLDGSSKLSLACNIRQSVKQGDCKRPQNCNIN